MDRLGYKNEIQLADSNEVLDLEFLKPIWRILSLLDTWKSIEWIKWAKKVEEWYKIFKVMYSYTDSYNKKTWYQEDIISKISAKKENCDLMNLVEISVWRLLESYFSSKLDNVRVRKTTMADDYLWSVDYIIEFKWENWKIDSAVWVDLTVFESMDEYELERRLIDKKKKKHTKPLDYIKYIQWTWKWNIQEIPRIILHFNKDVAYHFTNNYFADIFEKWKILSDEQIRANLDYAIDDFNDFSWMKNVMNIDKVNYKILNLISESKNSAINTLNKK